MIDFNDILYQLGIFDVRYQGVFNTWTNKQPSQPIAKKLDRQLVNQAWVSTFPNSSATFLANDFSDHTPCTLDLATPSLSLEPSPTNSLITSPNTRSSCPLWKTLGLSPEVQ